MARAQAIPATDGDLTIRIAPSARAAAVAAARARLANGRLTAATTKRRLERWLTRAAIAWDAQPRGVRIAIAAAALFALAATLNLASVTLVRATAPRPPPVASATVAAPRLAGEVEPTQGARTWRVVAASSGSGIVETAPFTVTEHWRIDWLFSPTQPRAVLQVFVFAADSRQLLQLATNTAAAGADSRFWIGPGKYYLRINASGGDWKVAVQELR